MDAYPQGVATLLDPPSLARVALATSRIRDATRTQTRTLIMNSDLGGQGFGRSDVGRVGRTHDLTALTLATPRASPVITQHLSPQVRMLNGAREALSAFSTIKRSRGDRAGILVGVIATKRAITSRHASG